MIPRIALLASLVLLHAPSALAAPVTGPERIVVFSVNETQNDLQPLQTIHATLVDKDQQAVGEMDVIITPTMLEVNPGDPIRGIVNATATLPRGQIVFQGAFAEGGKKFEVAIVGGTDDYRRARGYVVVTPGMDVSQPTRLVFHVND
jgi:hypothetical protein